MTDEIVIVDRVQVDIGELGEFAHEFAQHAAIPVSEPLQAVYVNRGGSRRVCTVYGFTANGQPLVLNDDGTRLVTVWGLKSVQQQFLGVQRPDNPPLTGPFTPAPAGLVAVFQDGRKVPVVFYDVHGRAVLLGEDDHRNLYLAEEDEALVRIEGNPGTDP